MAVAGSISLITSDQIADEAITTTKLHDDSVTNDKLGSDISITNAQLAGSIANSKLVNDSVTVNGTSNDLGASETISAGKILQVVSVTKTSAFFITVNNSFTDITGLTLNITPSATSSKIHIFVDTQMSGNELFFVQLVRGSTAICIGDSDSSNRVECSQGGAFQSSNNDKVSVFSLNHVDSPNTTSATTYKLQCQIYGTSKTLTVNRTFNDSDSTFTGRGASTITAYEIAG